jgi:phospholipid/cholesterol/gamma-HCH transport system substrate-binding protein
LYVKFRLDKIAFRIPKDSKARISSSDLLGTKEITIIPGVTTQYIKSGDTLVSEMEISIQDQVNQVILPLKTKVENLISSVDTIIVRFNAIFDDSQSQSLTSSLTNIQNTIRNLERISSNLSGLIASEREKISNIISNVESIAKNLNDNNARISAIIENTKTISDSLAASDIKAIINNTNSVMARLDSTMAKIESGQGTIGGLVNDDGLYKNIDSIAARLNWITEDIKLNPGNYVHFSIFGRKNKSNKNDKK